MTDRNPIEIRCLRGGEQPPANGTWLVAVTMPGGGCELIVSAGPNTAPVSIRTGLPLEQALQHATDVAVEYVLETIYVLGAAPS